MLVFTTVSLTYETKDGTRVTLEYLFGVNVIAEKDTAADGDGERYDTYVANEYARPFYDFFESNGIDGTVTVDDIIILLSKADNGNIKNRITTGDVEVHHDGDQTDMFVREPEKYQLQITSRADEVIYFSYICFTDDTDGIELPWGITRGMNAKQALSAMRLDPELVDHGYSGIVLDGLLEKTGYCLDVTLQQDFLNICYTDVLSGCTRSMGIELPTADMSQFYIEYRK